jgi:hypothetical protein
MTPLEELPRLWQREIKELRSENARLRIRSRELRLHLDDALTELAELKAEISR